MRFVRVLVVVPIWLLLTAEGPSPAPSPSSNVGATPSPSPSPTPEATIPPGAFLSLDVTQGDPKTKITVTGSRFAPNSQISLYWDVPAKDLGPGFLTVDGRGAFTVAAGPWPNDAPGRHRICASATSPPSASGSNTCANFTLLAATPSPSPTPSEAPSPSPSPSPSSSPEPTPSQFATPARTNGSLSGFDVISRPPFVFLPLFGIGALLLALGYWAITALRKPRRLTPIPTAAVVHRATRPDYSATFGAPPPRQPDAMQQPAWSERMPPQASPPAPALPSYSRPARSSQADPPTLPAPEQEPPAYEWGLGEPDTGYPDLRKRLLEDEPEPPPPAD